jgi:hypothetical protein
VQCLLERTASWAGVSELDHAVRVFHQEVLHDLRMILTDAGLRNWYVAKRGAEAEVALRLGILLRRADPAARFLYPSPPNEFGEDDEWTGLGAGPEGESTGANATDAEVPESSELGSVTAVPDDEGAAQFSGSPDDGSTVSEDGVYYGDPIDDEDFALYERHADEAMSEFTLRWSSRQDGVDY